MSGAQKGTCRFNLTRTWKIVVLIKFVTHQLILCIVAYYLVCVHRVKSYYKDVTLTNTNDLMIPYICLRANGLRLL